MKPVPRLETLPVAVIGAGPVGLAAAAELAARGIPFIVLEAGPAVGAHIRAWRHVRMFSPWRYDLAKAARRLLEAQGWTAPDEDALPTGGDLLDRYLEPLAEADALKPAIRLNARVTAISRVGLDKLKDAGRATSPFLIRHADAGGAEGETLARAVIDCSGTWSHPNPAGHSGLAALGETAHAARIAYGMPDALGSARARYAGRQVAVIGSGHSAIGTLLDLADLRDEAAETGIIWLSRHNDLRRVLGGGEKDGLPARGALGMRLGKALEKGIIRAIHPFALGEISAEASGRLILRGVGQGAEGILCDELVVATGFRPDLAILGEIRLDLDPALEAPRALAPLIDPNVHSCGTVRPHGARELAQPEPGFYIAGMKSYGRAPTFLLATGYEQVRSIVAEIAGDHAAAARVELDLPETGVCATDFADSKTDACCAPAATKPAGAPAASCCGGPPKVDQASCCVADEAAKASGAEGCGCGAQPARAAAPAA